MKIHLNVPLQIVCIFCVLNVTSMAIVENSKAVYDSFTAMGTYTCRNYEPNKNAKFYCNFC